MTTPFIRRARKIAADTARKGRETISTVAPAIDAVQRHALICETAYRRAERRGFVPGGELDDWLIAEREVDDMLMSCHPAAPAASRES